MVIVEPLLTVGVEDPSKNIFYSSWIYKKERLILNVRSKSSRWKVWFWHLLKKVCYYMSNFFFAGQSQKSVRSPLKKVRKSNTQKIISTEIRWAQYARGMKKLNYNYHVELTKTNFWFIFCHKILFEYLIPKKFPLQFELNISILLYSIY